MASVMAPYPALPASTPPSGLHAADERAVQSASSGWPLCLRTTVAVGLPGGGGKWYQLEFKCFLHVTTTG